MTTWSDVVVTIPTVPERAEGASALMHEVKDVCPNVRVFLHTHVPGTPARVDFPRALAQAAEVAARMGRRWLLQLEDDVALAPSFGAEALAAGLEEADVLTLFSRSQRDVEALGRGERVRRIGPSAFSMSQGFLITWELAAGVEAFAPAWYAAHPEHNRAADLLLAAYLSHCKARVLVRVPSLVQHRPGPSTLPGHRGARQSETYRLAFGEVA